MSDMASLVQFEATLNAVDVLLTRAEAQVTAPTQLAEAQVLAPTQGGTEIDEESHEHRSGSEESLLDLWEAAPAETHIVYKKNVIEAELSDDLSMAASSTSEFPNALWNTPLAHADADVDKRIPPLAIWTRDGHLLGDEEQDTYERQVVRYGGKAFAEEHDIRGLLAVPIGYTEQKSLPKVLLHPHIDSTQFEAGRRAGKRLMHSRRVISGVLDRNDTVKISKVGYAANPVWRLGEYIKEDSLFTDMVLLDWSFSQDTIEMEEAALIQMHEDEEGCRNVASGGEGRPTRNRRSGALGFFLYVVWGRAGRRGAVRARVIREGRLRAASETRCSYAWWACGRC